MRNVDLLGFASQNQIQSDQNMVIIIMMTTQQPTHARASYAGQTVNYYKSFQLF